MGPLRIDALEGIDLEVRAGEFFCIVGPSGCGKTTLLRILAGLETKSAGKIEIARETLRSGTAARPLNSMVFQEQSIFPWKSVRDNVAFGLKARGFSRRERYEIAEAYIRKVGLAGFEHALPHQLSGGMKQRVSIARAFANDPELMLMDEPFAALDEQTKLVLQAELLRIWEEARKTVVYVTHSIDEAIVLADRILVMSARPGRIKDIIDIGAIFPRPRHVDSVKSSARYGEVFGRIWGLLRHEVAAAKAEQDAAAQARAAPPEAGSSDA
ncbi:MAG TPA: ABC transporter ATP-binding protein [Stellaceae bacterium]|nr:ABC transporter ATP-binding protein [Stellaceae bacterium]